MLLAYDDDGPGPVVVLLHGFPLDRSMWSHQRSSVGRIYRLIAPDLRGHGQTAAPDGIYPVDAMADDVIELLDALQLTSPLVLGGHSMGGYLALSIAARHPERLKALMLINTKAGADSTEAAQARETLAAEVEAADDAGPVVAAMIPKLFAPGTDATNPGLVARVRSRMARTPARALAGALRGMAIRPDRTAELATIAVPTLVLAGAGDQLIPVAESERMARSIPAARLATIPDAGHLSPLENPGGVDGAVLGFLESLW